MKFTDAKVRALRPGVERYEVWEDGRTGLGVRVFPTGKKSWIYMYRFEGRARRMTLGRYPSMTLAEANIEHATAKQAVASGIDPGARKVASNEEGRRAETFADLADHFLRWAEDKRRRKTVEEYRRIVSSELLPKWGRRKAKDITREDVFDILDPILERGASVMFNRTKVLISNMFNHAIKQGHYFRDFSGPLDNPALLISSEEERGRTRTLTDEEIKVFWKGVRTLPGIATSVRYGLLLLLVTGQRRNEVARMRLDELSEMDVSRNADNTDISNVFTLPVWALDGGRVKNDRPHLVPLSPLAKRLIDDALNEVGDGEWVLKSPRTDIHITPERLTRGFEEIRDELGLSDVVPHDLRRTVATGMARLQVDRLVGERVQNHRERSVHGPVYDQYEYLPEKYDALTKWGTYIENLLEAEAWA